MAENFLEQLTSDYRIPLTPGINIKKTTFRHIIKKLTISEEKKYIVFCCFNTNTGSQKVTEYPQSADNTRM